MKTLEPVEDNSAEIEETQELEGLVEEFIQAQDVSGNSRDTYQRELNQFMNWLVDTGRQDNLNQLDRGDILEYKDWLKNNYSAYTINSYLTSVRKFFSWLESNKIYPNVAKDIKGVKKPKGHRRDSLTPDQVREALDSIDRDSLKGKRDYALFNLLARTGLRVIEVARAQVGDIRQKSGEAVLWIQGKGRSSKDDFVLLTTETLKPLRAYLSAREEAEEDDPLFISLSNRNYGGAMTTRSISRVVKNILQEINLNSDRFTAHSLRHTAITLAIQGGADLHQAQSMARHSDPKTTQRYYHNLNRIEEGAEKCIQI